MSDKKELNLSGLDEIYDMPHPEEVKKDEKPAINLTGLEQVLNQEQPSTLHDFGKGLQQGATLEGADEIGGGMQSAMNAIMSMGHNIAPNLVGASPTQVSMALKKMGITGDVGPVGSQFYRKAQEENQKEDEEAAIRSPYAHGAGELTGGIGSAVASAGILPELKAAKDAGKLARAGTSALNAAPIGAGFGLLGSKGHLVAATPEEQKQVLKDTAVGTATASALGFGAKLGGDLIASTDTGKRLAGYFKLGAEGKDLGDDAARLGTLENPAALGDTVSMHDTQAANKVLDGLNTMDDHLGQEVGNVVAQATQKGIKVQPTSQINKYITELEPMIGNSEFTDTMQKLSTEGLNPAELQQFRNQLADYGRKIYSKDQVAASKVFDTTKELTNMLRQNVPEYSTAANRLNEFRQLLPETILSKDNPIDVTNLRVSGTRNVDTKLLNNVKSMIRGMYNPSNAKAQGSYTNLLQGLQKLEQNEQLRKAEAEAAGKPFKTVFDTLGMQPQDIEAFFKEAGGKSKLIQNYTGLSDVDLSSLAKPFKTIGKAADFVANKVGVVYGKTGSAAQNPVLNVGKKLYAASDDSLRELSKKLDGLPGQKNVGLALNKALDKKDTIAKNAVLFSIMQNPNLRSVVESDNLAIEP